MSNYNVIGSFSYYTLSYALLFRPILTTNIFKSITFFLRNPYKKSKILKKFLLTNSQWSNTLIKKEVYVQGLDKKDF